MESKFNYYYGKESEQFSFLCIPKVLFEDEKHFGSLSNDARILYAFLHERMSLSRKNNWLDEENRVYIIYTIEDIADRMKCSKGKAVKILQELDDEKGIGLISKRRKGMGQPTIIYVKNFIIEDDDEFGEQISGEAAEQKNVDEAAETASAESCKEPANPVKSTISKIEIQELQKLKFNNSKNCNSRVAKNEIHEFRNLESKETLNKSFQPYAGTLSVKQIRAFPHTAKRLLRIIQCFPNNIDNNYTEVSYIDNQSINLRERIFSGRIDRIDNIARADVEEEVKKQIDYQLFESYEDDDVRSMAEEIKNIIVDVMCGERNVFVEGKRISEEAAKSAYRRLTSEHILYVLENILNYPERINKVDRFIAAVLYNASYTLSISTFCGITAHTGVQLI